MTPELIGAVALGEGDEADRARAVRSLPDGEILRRLAGLRDGDSPAPPAGIEQVAQVRMAQLIDSGAIDFSGLCAPPRNTSALLAVAGHCASADQLSVALGLIEDPLWMARLAVEGSSSRLRQLAAQRVMDPAALRALLKQAREHDKNVYKIVKQKCDDLRAQERHGAQIESDAVAACASLERHSHRVHDPIYEPTFRHFHARWLALEDRAAPQTRDRARVAIDRCREIMAAHSLKLAEQAAQASRQAALQAEREQAAAQLAEEIQLRIDREAAAAVQAQLVREAEEMARADAHAKEAHALRRVGALAAGAHKALRDGNTGRAAGLRRAIEEKLAQLPALPGHLAAQLHGLDSKLNELKQWKDYAVAPKRAELIAEMEGLAGSTESPQALADRIRRLKDDWRTISKGVVSESEADWQRFHQASVAAFQPCREYFEAQSRLRQQNLKRRGNLLERLRAFEDKQTDEHPDWRLMATVIREARQGWRRHSPVDRAEGHAVEKEYDAAIGRLQGRIDGWHERNAAQKRALIESARRLGALADSRDAMEEMKALQRRWKAVGAAPHDVERKLWDEFREQGDAVYQKRQQAHSDRVAGLEANKSQAVALCLEAERVADLAGPALIEGVAKIPQWRADFEAVGELPRAELRALQDRFERAVQHCRSQAERQRARDHEAAVGSLLEANRLIQDYGWAVAQDAAAADRESLKRIAVSFIAGVRQWPKGGAAALKDAWAQAESAARLDMAAQERALRMLCVRAEILTERPTPLEDQVLRREYQVQRLVERMGRGGAAEGDQLETLALAWVRVGPAAAAARESLFARFVRCRSPQDHQGTPSNEFPPTPRL